MAGVEAMETLEGLIRGCRSRTYGCSLNLQIQRWSLGGVLRKPAIAWWELMYRGSSSRSLI